MDEDLKVTTGYRDIIVAVVEALDGTPFSDMAMEIKRDLIKIDQIAITIPKFERIID
jgi:hypothetical protein